MSTSDEIFETAQRFERAAARGSDPSVRRPIQARVDAANRAARAHSGSWLGYHARVYQQGLEARPGAVFDSQWGLTHHELGDSRGDWGEYDPGQVKAGIRSASDDADFQTAVVAARTSRSELERAKADLISILHAHTAERPDSYLSKLLGEAEKLEGLSERAALLAFRPAGQFMSGDAVAIGGGLQTPPHIEVLAELVAITTVFDAAGRGGTIARQAASHIERLAQRRTRSGRVGTNVFIGHGRSPLWRELKDFVEDRLNLPADEFNRVPVAGVTNIARLGEMLDAAAIAFVIMTAEDETHEGKMQARMNVVHEIGLFQGRLGFEKAIIMLEQGCEEFSNIAGLSQIRFPKGNMSATYEEVRRVLEREGLIPGTGAAF